MLNQKYLRLENKDGFKIGKKKSQLGAIIPVIGRFKMGFWIIKLMKLSENQIRES